MGTRRSAIGHLRIPEENWAELTFAKASGTVTGDREKTGQWLTGMSLVMIPEVFAKDYSAQFPSRF